MNLAGDRVAGCDSLAYLQLTWQVIRNLGAIAHLLILGPHLLPPCLQFSPLLQEIAPRCSDVQAMMDTSAQHTIGTCTCKMSPD